MLITLYVKKQIDATHEQKDIRTIGKCTLYHFKRYLCSFEATDTCTDNTKTIIIMPRDVTWGMFSF